MVLHGLRLVEARGFRCFMLEVDLKPMVGRLLANNEPRLLLMNLIQACYILSHFVTPHRLKMGFASTP